MGKNRWLHRSIVAVTALAAAGGLTFVGSHSHPSSFFDVAQAQPTTVTVSIPQGATGKGAQAYGQNPLQISVGTTVTWVNNDTTAHTVSSDTGQFGSGILQPGDSYQHTFDTSGTYPYHCVIHGQQSMSGVVQVGSGGAGGAAGTGGTAGGGGGPGPLSSPVASPVSSPISSPSAPPSPVAIAGYTCDAQGNCCSPTKGCVPSNNYTCNSLGQCCLYEPNNGGVACSKGYECANGYCCNTEGHCGTSKYGSGAGYCDRAKHTCCDRQGKCSDGFTDCDTYSCTNHTSGVTISEAGHPEDPRPTPSLSPSPSPSLSYKPSPSPSPSPRPSPSPSPHPLAGPSGSPSSNPGSSASTTPGGNEGGTSGGTTGGTSGGGTTTGGDNTGS